MLVEIETFTSAVVGEIARSRLAAEGIDAVLFDAGIAGIGLGGLLPARLMVEERDRARALRAIAGG